MLDSITGIVLYSRFNYTLSGFQDGSDERVNVMPLLAISQDISYSPETQGFWKANESFQYTHSFLYWGIVVLIILLAASLTWLVWVKISMKVTKQVYIKLRDS